MSAINSKMLITVIIELLILLLVFFLAAGTVFWFYGWILLILVCSFSFPIVLWVLRHNPGLIRERTIGFKSDDPTWDKAYIVLLGILFSIWWISMPLDAVRFHWSQMPTWLHIVGAVVLSCSFYLLYLTYRENPYLWAAVRVQEDLGQTVVSTGPYRYVRHPMYTSVLLVSLGSALLLGSWIGVLLGLLLEGIFAMRAVREERVLQKGLKGYDAYMARVRYRLVPHVW